jgi:hypothetical protein
LFRTSDKQKCRTADYLRSTCWPASRRHRADNVESEAVAAAKSLPGGALGIARLASLQVTPIESACKYAEGRDNSDDHDDLCRHRTNSIWFIGTIKRNSSPPGFDLDQTECRKFNAQPWPASGTQAPGYSLPSLAQVDVSDSQLRLRLIGEARRRGVLATINARLAAL